MSDHEFNIRTKLADPKGLNELEAGMQRIETQAKRITAEMAKWAAPGLAGSMASGGASHSSGGAGGVGGTYSPPTRRRASGGGASGQNYNLGTQQGLMDWTENVYAPIAEMMQGFFGGVGTMHTTVAASHHAQVTRMARGGAASRTGPASSKRVRGTAMSHQINNWFSTVDKSTLDAEGQQAYTNAQYGAMSYNGSTVAPTVREFYQHYGQQNGAPGFPTPVAGGAGGSGGGMSHMAQFGYGLGSMAKKSIPFMTVAGATMFVGSQAMQGTGLWQQTSAPVDQVAHSLGNAAKDVETFRKQVLNAGAAFGIAGQQSAQMLATITQAVGSIGQSNLANAVGQSAQFAYNNGLSGTQGAQLYAIGATLGITSGKGASMSRGAYMNMLGNMATQGGMQGRIGPMSTEYSSLASQIGNLNPSVSNPQGLAGMVSAMSATGIQGLQGARGQQVAGQFISGLASPNGFAQNLSFSAIMQASGNHVSNPLQMLELMQKGPQTKIPGTNTTVGEAVMNLIKKQTNNPYQQAAMMVSAGLSPSLAYAQSTLKVKKPFSTTVSTQNNQTSWASTYDMNQIQKDFYQVGQSAVGGVLSLPATAFHGLGFGGGALTAFAAAKYAPKMLGGVARGIGGAARGMGGIFSRFAGAGAGAATDATAAGGTAAAAGGVAADAGVVGAMGAAGGLETAGAAADATGIGLPVGLALGAIGLGVGGYALWRSHQHAAAHNVQVASTSPSTAKFPSRINTLTIDTLHINSIHMPTSGGASSMFNGMSNVYAPSSNASSGSSSGGASFLGGIANWIMKQVGLGGASGGGGSSGTFTGANIKPGVTGYASTINQAASKYGIPAGVIGAVMQQESGGNQNEISSTGAIGLMQLEPGTAAGLGVNPYNAAQNITGGAKDLSSLYKSYHSWGLSLAAYNAGVGTVNGLRRQYGNTYADIQSHLPSQTQQYVPSVESMMSAMSKTLQQAMENALSNHTAKQSMNLHVGTINP